MSRSRDDARRNARREFATTRADGTPVGSFVVTYADLCADAFDEHGASFAASFGPSHVPGSHTSGNRIMRAPYTFDAFDSYDD